ncbi:hypothetical protein LCGC14_0297730 [marine sediment metagenome]|uniref:Uncharacterized protein n=1 Tax=marine sediment metagenome TaxID=412755 RepID=A0A0F9TW30_9ZZZZ
MTDTPEILSVKAVLVRLHGRGRGFKYTCQFTDGEEWIVGRFRFRYYSDSYETTWNAWARHPDGEELLIVHGFIGHGQPWLLHGEWNAELQEVLREINDACFLGEQREKQEQDERDVKKAVAAAKSKAKFNAFFKATGGKV